MKQDGLNERQIANELEIPVEDLRPMIRLAAAVVWAYRFSRLLAAQARAC